MEIDALCFMIEDLRLNQITTIIITHFMNTLLGWLVSLISAYNTIPYTLALSKSLLKSMKSNNINTDPCGTSLTVNLFFLITNFEFILVPCPLISLLAPISPAIHHQSINQSVKIYTAPLQDLPNSEALPTQAKRKRTVSGGIENRHRLGGTLDLLEVHSRFLDQTQKMNGSTLLQSGRMGPPSYREQRTRVYDGLH